ncbi:MAG: hypothetical protein PUH25_06995, partial [Spirochaetales bacterium]|nr:hypothetical protein [Spirochaetales bacterium]
IMMIAMDISAFNDEEKYFSDVDARINELKSSKKAKYSNGILMPGEIEANKFAASEKSGIVEVLSENLDMVNDIAKEMAIEPIAIIK